ncbi:MAG: hypothetical protein ACE5GZ_08365 [Gammaproteobacteria bacterium]
MPAEVSNGTKQIISGEERIYYDGYWIRYYDVPTNLAYKKQLIDQLKRRVFHHTEPGINTPGERLEEVRAAYNKTNDPANKRVLAAMLAGALLNRGSDILTKVVELEEIGITIKSNNELLRECGRCFMGALEYGKYIRPLKGEEELDELWGEPFKAFTMTVDQFLETRYIKIAQAMHDIDAISGSLIRLFESTESADMFAGIPDLLRELASSAKQAIETLRSDPAIIDIWPRLVGTADKFTAFTPIIPEGSPQRIHTMGKRGVQILHDGTALIVDLANIRVAKPKSTTDLLHRCDEFSKKYLTKLKKAG